MTPHKAKYALLLIGVSVLFLSLTANAQPEPGITVTLYNNQTWYNQYNASPPLPPTTPIAGTAVVSQINQNFDSQPMFNLYEDFVARYESWITAPCTCSIRFMAQADDGTILYLNNQLVTYDWYDKGGGGSVSEPVEFEYGVPQRLLLWFYENGGGAWVKLYWMLDNSWQVIPASAYSTVESWTTTTTTNTLPPTTEPSTTSSPTSFSTTTTTLPDPPTTTSTSLPPTTTVPNSTTTVNPSPSTVSSSSTSLPPVPQPSKPSPTTTPTTTPTSTSTVVSEASTSLPETTTTTTSPPIAPTQEKTNQNGKTYSRKVSLGPIKITLTATEAQRKTVIAAAIVQIATVATLSTTGVSTTSSSSSSTSRRRR